MSQLHRSRFKMSSDELRICSERPLPHITPATADRFILTTPLICHCAGLEMKGGNELRVCCKSNGAPDGSMGREHKFLTLLFAICSFWFYLWTLYLTLTSARQCAAQFLPSKDSQPFILFIFLYLYQF